MTEENFNELIYSNNTVKIAKLVSEYKEILESGTITYEQFVDMYTLDKEIFIKRQLELESVMLKDDVNPFYINQIENTQTSILSIQDSKEKALALRIANDLLYPRDEQ